MPRLIDQALEKICLFAHTETDGLGIIYYLFEMFRLRREIEFIVENQAVDIYTSFLKRKSGKTLHQKNTDFVKSCCKIKDKDTLKKLEGIPYVEQNQ